MWVEGQILACNATLGSLCEPKFNHRRVVARHETVGRILYSKVEPNAKYKTYYGLLPQKVIICLPSPSEFDLEYNNS